MSALLARLSRLNPTTVFLGALVVVLLGLFAPGAVGGVLLLILALSVGALVAATWERRPNARPLRLGVLLLLLLAALIKII